MKIFDITVPLQEDMPLWPNTAKMKLVLTQSLKSGDQFNVSRLDLDVHTGTHIDAPRHVLEDGTTVDQLPLEVLIGPATVAHLPNVDFITDSDLDGLDLPAGTLRLMLRTKNSQLWAAGITEFQKDYVALTSGAAEWVVDHKIRLLGIDYLSVQMYEDLPVTHRILLEAGVVVVEGLNLAGIEQGAYELICLPLRLVNAEGAPARAILLKRSEPTPYP